MPAHDLRYFGTFQNIRQAADSGLLYGSVTQRETDLRRHGTLTWPVPGARIIAMQALTPVAQTKTAEDGTFTFFGLPQGEYRREFRLPARRP